MLLDTLSPLLLPLVIAALTGGVVVKILDNLFKTPDLIQSLRFKREDRELAEINRLRTDVDCLRSDVTTLRADLDTQIRENHTLKERWYALRTVVTSLISYLRHKDLLNDDPELKRLADEASSLTQQD